MKKYVMDSYAMIAFFENEPGAEKVELICIVEHCGKFLEVLLQLLHVAPLDAGVGEDRTDSALCETPCKTCRALGRLGSLLVIGFQVLGLYVPFLIGPEQECLPMVEPYADEGSLLHDPSCRCSF